MTVDIVVWTIRESRLHVLLIRRAHDPFESSWAFPGGFVDPEEPLVRTAARELKEETGVVASDFHAIDAFGDPGRDPRGWTVSAAYYTVLPDGQAKPKAADDARAVAWKSADDPPTLAFDHAKILATALRRFRNDIYAAPVAAPLVGSEFSLRELHQLYRILDPAAPVLSASFRRRLDANGLVRPAGSTNRFRWNGSPPVALPEGEARRG
jgi:8-oxo-dGTP diphosphatase